MGNRTANLQVRNLTSEKSQTPKPLRTEEIGLSQTSDLKIDTYCFLAQCSALLGEGKDWLAQCQDNVTEWDIRS